MMGVGRWRARNGDWGLLGWGRWAGSALLSTRQVLVDYGGPEKLSLPGGEIGGG